MDTLEWFGLLIFLVIVTLLFFAAFGGSKLSDSSVEEYLSRLMKEDEKRGPQKEMQILWFAYNSEAHERFLFRFGQTKETLGMQGMQRHLV